MRIISLNVLMAVLWGFNITCPAEVRLGSQSLGVTFDDSSLSVDEKAIIVEDINNVLSTTPSSARLKPFDANDKRSATMAGRIDTGSKGHQWPRMYWKSGFGTYRENLKTGKTELVVSKELSDAFREAIAFRKKNQKAFDELDIFLATIEQGFDPSSMSFDDKKSLFWFAPGQKIWGKESYFDDNLREMKTVRFYKPSLMTFTEEAAEGMHLILCKPIVKPKSNGAYDQMVLVYDGESWRIRAY